MPEVPAAVPAPPDDDRSSNSSCSASTRSATPPPAVTGTLPPGVVGVDGEVELPPAMVKRNLHLNKPIFPKTSKDAAPPKQPYDYFMILDFEATCEKDDQDWPNEIIEMPIVVVDAVKNDIVAEFHSYVKPKKFGGKLTEFCVHLTGIQQATVDAAPTLEEVIESFNQWFQKTIPEGKSVMFVTDGPWDLREFMYHQAVVRDGVDFPPVFYHFVDLKAAFSTFIKCRTRNVTAMLEGLDMTFVGRQHSGIDDARNIARIFMKLHSLGCVFDNAVKVETVAELAAVTKERRLARKLAKKEKQEKKAARAATTGTKTQ